MRRRHSSVQSDSYYRTLDWVNSLPDFREKVACTREASSEMVFKQKVIEFVLVYIVLFFVDFFVNREDYYVRV